MTRYHLIPSKAPIDGTHGSAGLSIARRGSLKFRRGILLAALAALALVVLGQPGLGLADEAGTRFIIKNVRIFDGARVIPRGYVVLANGRIAAVGDKGEPTAGGEAIDGEGHTLLPGLIDRCSCPVESLF